MKDLIITTFARLDFGENAGTGRNIFRGGVASSPRPPWNVSPLLKSTTRRVHVLYIYVSVYS